jgi:hypothetical protein
MKHAALFFAALALAASATLAISDDAFFYNAVTGESRSDRPDAMPIRDTETGEDFWVIGGVSTWGDNVPSEYAWREHADPDGRPYFHNFKTDETVWERPEAAAWTARSRTRVYWHNKVTNASQWETPTVLGHFSDAHNATYYTNDGNEVTWEPPSAAKWREVTHDTSGTKYYHHPETDVTTWDVPAESVFAWEKHYDVEL